MPPISQAGATFANAIQEAEVLLKHFSGLPQQLHHGSKVLKSAGLVMALTAWETYVEDRVLEEVDRRWGYRPEGNTATAGQLLRSKLEEELRGFHTPDAGKTRKLFMDYVAVDVTAGWKMPGFTPEEAVKRLNALTKKRGEVVHRAKAMTVGGPSQQHLVKKDELSKHIRFLKELVRATDGALEGKGTKNETSNSISSVVRAPAAAVASPLFLAASPGVQQAMNAMVVAMMPIIIFLVLGASIMFGLGFVLRLLNGFSKKPTLRGGRRRRRRVG